MSLTVSLTLTALGGVFYKYDRSQKFMVDPQTSIEWKDISSKVYKHEINKINTRVVNIMSNFAGDFMRGSPWWYPINGTQDLFANRKKYMKSVLGFMGLYLFSFAFIITLYWITITPIYLTLLIMFGPFGIWLATIHSFLHANVLTMLFVRLINPSNTLVFQCLSLRNYTKLRVGFPIRYYVPISAKYFWIYHLPIKVIKYSILILLFIVQLSI